MNKARNRIEPIRSASSDPFDRLMQKRSDILERLTDQLNEAQRRFFDLVKSMGDDGFPNNKVDKALQDCNLSLEDFRKMFDLDALRFDSERRVIKIKRNSPK